jgi:hypothetical protein
MKLKLTTALVSLLFASGLACAAGSNTLLKVKQSVGDITDCKNEGA